MIAFKIKFFFFFFKHILPAIFGKESACSLGDAGLISGLGRFPGGGKGNPLQYSCLGNPMGGQKQTEEMAGYSPWGHKGLDLATEGHTHIMLSRPQSYHYLCVNIF